MKRLRLFILLLFFAPLAQAQNTFCASNLSCGVTGPWTFANMNAIQFVDGVTNTTPTQAISKCPATDCWVFVPPGTYTGPSSFPSHLHLTGYNPGVPTTTITAGYNTNLAWGTPPADKKVIFTYTSALTITALWDSTIEGITFDFGNNNAGIVMAPSGTGNNIINNTFDIVIQNVGTTGVGLTMNSTPNNSVVANEFKRLFVFNSGEGLKLTGTSPAASGNNIFDYVYINAVATVGIDFFKQCDSNHFGVVFIGGLANTAPGIIFNNTGTPTADVDADGNHITYLITDVQNGGLHTAPIIQMNQASGTVISAWEVGGGITNEIATQGTPNYTIAYATDFSTPGNSNFLAQIGPMTVAGRFNISSSPVAIGTLAGLAGTGACSTITTQVGGAWAGTFKCTGTTGASTVVITPGLIAPNGFSCWANDLTTGANILRQSAVAGTTCTIAGTINTNDILTFGAVAY